MFRPTEESGYGIPTIGSNRDAHGGDKISLASNIREISACIGSSKKVGGTGREEVARRQLGSRQKKRRVGLVEII
jgi:hypothetical protein